MTEIKKGDFVKLTDVVKDYMVEEWDELEIDGKEVYAHINQIAKATSEVYDGFVDIIFKDGFELDACSIEGFSGDQLIKVSN